MCISDNVICLAIDACLTINTQNNKINKTPIITGSKKIVLRFITMGVFIISYAKSKYLVWLIFKPSFLVNLKKANLKKIPIFKK